MPHYDTIKDPRREQRSFTNRAMLAGLVCAALLIIVLGRMAYLQITSHEHFTTLSQSNRVQVRVVPPPRGLIYDRNGVALAENLPGYRLEITPDQAGDLERTLAKLTDLIHIKESDLAHFRRDVKRKKSFQSTALRLDMTEQEVAKFSVNRHHFPGVEIVARLTRHYPQGETGVHALGYVGRIAEGDLRKLDPANYNGTTHIGKLGIEKHYERMLHGSAGYQHVEVNAEGRTLRVLQEQRPVPGKDLILTLDIGLQAAAEKALAGHSGAIVVMEPASGEVLALVSMPGYNPNLFTARISNAEFNALRDNPDRPLFNRALSGQYPPGSTIKPMMGLAGLDYGVTWPNRTIYAGAYYSLPNDDRKYRDWRRAGHGNVNLDTSIVQSSDVYFYDLAYRLGIDRIHPFLTRFGLGEPSGLDTFGEAPGLLPSREWKRREYNQHWFPGETLIAGIGQGYVLTTPVQLAAATSTLAMRGRRMRPRLLRAVNDATTGEQRLEASRITETVALKDDNYWDHIARSMVGVVHRANGTARRIGYDAPYLIAGKTGTAQVFGLNDAREYDASTLAQRLRDHAMFIGFAPAEKPRIAIAVVVENGGGGGSVAAPVAREVMDYYLLTRKGLGSKG